MTFIVINFEVTFLFCNFVAEKKEIMNYKDNKLGLTEYTAFFFENLSTLVTNQAHIDENKNFYDEVVFKTFEIYQKNSSDYTITEILNFIHVFLYAMFNEKPSVEKPEDKITLRY